MINKNITLLFSLLIVFGCQTTKPQLSSHNQPTCQVVIPDIPASEFRLLEPRSPASKTKLDEIRQWLNSIPTSTLIWGGKEYLAHIYNTFNNKISGLNLNAPVDMTLLAGIPDPTRRASPDRTYVIDIAFLYPDTADPTITIPKIEKAVSGANVIFENSSVNAKLRIVATEPIPLSRLNIDFSSKLHFNQMNRILDHLTDELPKIRRAYGADLAYLILPNFESSLCGLASQRYRGLPKFLAAKWTAVGVVMMNKTCLHSNRTLAHEVGHNLGLEHNQANTNLSGESTWSVIENKVALPFVRGGRGYLISVIDPNNPDKALYGTMMAQRSKFKTIIYRFSSNTATSYGQRIGSADANASEALLYTIEDASNYSPTVIPESKD